MHLPQDVKLALRGLVRHKTATLLICGSLALAVAGNAIVFSLIEALVLRPFPYKDSQRLTFVWQSNQEQPGDETLASPADFTDWRQRAESFSRLEAFRMGSFNLTGGDQPEEVRALLTTPGGLALLGAEPQLGRTFLPEEGEPGRDRVTLLAYDLWQRRFGGDPGIVGRTVELDDRSHTVIGVLPEDFEFFLPGFDAWVPLALDPADLPRDHHELIVLGRLADGVSPDQARAEMTALARQLAAEHPETNRGLGAKVLTLREQIPGPTDRQLYSLLQGGMLFVLLIACANVANILLARAQDRQREIALRTTLGAGRRRVVRQLLVESLVLAALGGGLGLAMGAVGIDTLATLASGELPKMVRPALNAPVLAFTLGISAAAGLLFGLAPALAASRPDLAATLKDGSRGSTGSRRRRLVSRGLVVVEVTLALMMLSGTALLVRSMIELQSLDPGLEVADVLTFRLSLPEARYGEEAQVARFYGELVERLEAMPGVTAATATTSLPRSRNTPTAPFTRDDQPQPDAGQPPSAVSLVVGPGYFEKLGVPVLAGRSFTAADRLGDDPVALVSRGMVERYFGGESPLGRRLTIEGASRRIVGVAADVVQGRLLSREGPRAIVYLPHAQQPARALYLMLRTAGEVPGLPDRVRGAVWEMDAALPVAQMQSLEEHIAAQFTGARLIGGLIGVFGLVALLLAAVGIYGVVSYSVAQRTHEIGVRMAIGARRTHVVGQVTRQGLVLAGLGLALAIPGVLLVIRALQSMMGEVAPVAVATVPAVALVLAAVALLASYLPARRAAALDPVTALRTE